MCETSCVSEILPSVQNTMRVRNVVGSLCKILYALRVLSRRKRCACQESCRITVQTLYVLGILLRHYANIVHGIVRQRFLCIYGTNTIHGTVVEILDAFSTVKSVGVMHYNFNHIKKNYSVQIYMLKYYLKLICLCLYYLILLSFKKIFFP